MHRGADLGRRRPWRKVGVGIASRQVELVAQEVQECGAELGRARRAKSDRIRGARVDRDAVVRDVRRQVQHVARREHFVVLGREAPEDLERQPGLQREVVLRAESPAAAAEALQQEDVVGIHVRSDASARRGIAHHEVVEARERQEREPPQQRVARRMDEIDALHEQRPVARGQRREVGAAERTVRERPARAVAHDEARFDVVAARRARRARERRKGP